MNLYEILIQKRINQKKKKINQTKKKASTLHNSDIFCDLFHMDFSLYPFKKINK